MPVSTEAVADELKELYQDVMASNLSPRQKTDALAMLDALGKYSTPEHLRKTLLGIQMKGGAEAFFRRPGGSSQDELVNGQLNLRAELKGQLNQKEQELEHFTLWERAFAPNPEYRALQEQKKDIENNIRAVEDRLNRFAYGWEKGISIPDWNEVDEWEQAQLAEAAKVAEEKAKAAAEQKEAKALPGKNTNNEPRPIEELEISEKAIEVFIDREGNEPYLRATGIGQYDKNGKLIGIYPHYVNDGGITIGYGHHITQKALEVERQQKAFYDKYTPGATVFNGPEGTKVPNGLPMSIEEAHILLRKDIEFYKNRLIRELKERNALQKVSLTQQEFDALMLVSFNEGNVRTVYDLLIENNRDRSEWQNWWKEDDERESIALDIFFNGNYERRRE